MSLENALTFSIVAHLADQVPEVNEVVYVYDGVTLTGREKPFLTVEQMADTYRSVAAGHADFEEIHRWQIGVRARNIAERTRLQGTVKDVLRQRNIPLYDTRQPAPFPPVGVFTLNVTDGVPIRSENTADETNRHRLYFDVALRAYRTVADGINFTQ